MLFRQQYPRLLVLDRRLVAGRTTCSRQTRRITVFAYAIRPPPTHKHSLQSVRRLARAVRIWVRAKNKKPGGKMERSVRNK